MNNIMLKNTNMLKNTYRIFAMIMILLTFVSLFPMAYANETTTTTTTTTTNTGGATVTTIEGGIKGMSKQLFGIIKVAIVPIAAIVFAWNAFKVVFGGERGMEQAKKNMLIIIIVVSLIYLSPLIVDQVAGWFRNVGDAGIFD